MPLTPKCSRHLPGANLIVLGAVLPPPSGACLPVENGCFPNFTTQRPPCPNLDRFAWNVKIFPGCWTKIKIFRDSEERKGELRFFAKPQIFFGGPSIIINHWDYLFSCPCSFMSHRAILPLLNPLTEVLSRAPPRGIELVLEEKIDNPKYWHYVLFITV